MDGHKYVGHEVRKNTNVYVCASMNKEVVKLLLCSLVSSGYRLRDCRLIFPIHRGLISSTE